MKVEKIRKSRNNELRNNKKILKMARRNWCYTFGCYYNNYAENWKKLKLDESKSTIAGKLW